MVSAHPSVEPQKPVTRHETSLFRVDALRSRVAFGVRHAVGRVRGVFTRVLGVVTYDPRKPEATTARVTIQAASVVTNDETRDARLRSAGFLDARAFPEITFISTSARRSGRKLEVSGDLTLRGVTRPVTVTVGRPRTGTDGGAPGVSARVHAALLRSDFGVGPSSTLEIGGLLIGDEVSIDIDLELARAHGPTD